ncbi:hypothetical protein HDU76_007308 [Blyttiomyces sp. JEL0837]|nr:hypothetical protein HDU76_007308 [Blyttiomyces sp. JEL0837]
MMGMNMFDDHNDGVQYLDEQQDDEELLHSDIYENQDIYLEDQEFDIFEDTFAEDSDQQVEGFPAGDIYEPGQELVIECDAEDAFDTQEEEDEFDSIGDEHLEREALEEEYHLAQFDKQIQQRINKRSVNAFGTRKAHRMPTPVQSQHVVRKVIQNKPTNYQQTMSQPNLYLQQSQHSQMQPRPKHVAQRQSQAQQHHQLRQSLLNEKHPQWQTHTQQKSPQEQQLIQQKLPRPKPRNLKPQQRQPPLQPQGLIQQQPLIQQQQQDVIIPFQTCDIKVVEELLKLSKLQSERMQ